MPDYRAAAAATPAGQTLTRERKANVTTTIVGDSMKLFQAFAVVLMAAFFVWLLVAMSRTPEADRRLAAMALAFVGIFAALGLGALLGHRR